MYESTTHEFNGAPDTQVFALGDLGTITHLPQPQYGQGASLVKGVKVFKAGNFKDSLGRPTSWTAEQLAGMVSNFNTLKAAGILPKVPVRIDHTQSARDICGWFDSVQSDGQYLYADINFTEPEAAAKYHRGTYGPRSLEVGEYEDNNGNKYSPTVMGLAFVDIAAVEGLFGNATKGGYVQVLIEEKSPVGAGDGTGTSTTVPVGTGTQAAAFQAAGNQAGAAGGAGTGVPVATPGTPVQGTEGGAPVASFGASVTPLTFRLNGTEACSDYGRVQAHIIALETALSETVNTFRTSFVAGLASDGKIANTQVADLTALALTMSETQFASFSASYTAAPASTLFVKHGAGPTNPTGDVGTTNGGSTDALATAQQTVAMLARTMTQEKLEKTNAYKRLVVLQTATK